MARCVSDACYAEQLQMLCNERLPRRGTASPCSVHKRTFLPALLMHMIKSAFLFFTSVMTEIRSGWLCATFFWGNGVSSQWGEGLKDITCYISLVTASPIKWVQCDLVGAKLGTIYGCCQGFDVMASFAQRQITRNRYFLKQILHFSELLFLLGEENNSPGFLFLGKTKEVGGGLCICVCVLGGGLASSFTVKSLPTPVGSTSAVH